jgi:hypothetical protein
MVTYKPVSFFEKGTTQRILKASYYDFLSISRVRKRNSIINGSTKRKKPSVIP